MTKTAPRISFGLYTLETKIDATPAADDLQPFSKVDDLKRDNASRFPFATYEPDFWLLDGNYKFVPDDVTYVHVGLMTLAMSDENGDFAVPPVLTVNFGSVHNTDGLVLRFMPYSGDYASSFKAAYFDETDTLIREDTYGPDSPEFSTTQAVFGFKKIVLTFYSTSRPYRYLRLTGIDFGFLIFFEAEDIKSASVVEDTDIISGQARYNTCTLALFSSDAAFSIINPDSYAFYLQQRQPFSIYEKVDNGQVYIGQFYLNRWTNKSETEIEFNCIDLLGILDGIEFRGGIYSGVEFQTLIASLLEPIYIPYDIAPELYGVLVSGWLPQSSYRAALHQIALAAGVYMDCSRDSMIKFRKMPDVAASADAALLTRGEQGIEQSLSLKPLVTGVQVTAHNYIASTTAKEVYNGALEAGQHEISFREPLHDLSISGATIIESGVNYAIVEVAAPGTVVLSGQVYNDTTRVVSINGTYGALVKPNVMKITSATLITNANVSAVAQRIYDYYQMRYQQKLKLYVPAVQIGDVVAVETLYSQQMRGVVEKMTLDLSGGFTAAVELTGMLP
jgi:hypothetical protein